MEDYYVPHLIEINSIELYMELELHHITTHAQLEFNNFRFTVIN